MRIPIGEDLSVTLLREFLSSKVDAQLKQMEESELGVRERDSGRSVITRGCEGRCKCPPQHHKSLKFALSLNLAVSAERNAYVKALLYM